jgi:hypothetical protein
MSASPCRPAQPVVAITSGPGEQRREQVLDLGAGDRDQPGRYPVAGAFGKRCDGQDGVGEHGQRGPADDG